MNNTLPDTSGGRLHSLDAVRAIALLLGVVLHATMSFQSGLAVVGWPIVDSSPSVALDLLFYVIHVFRMATFFLIAGFFARLLRERRGTRAFIRDRLRRIALPLLAFWPVCIVLTSAALVWGVYQLNGGELPAAPEPAPGQGGFPLTHLWFLYLLLWMYAIVIGARAVLGPLARKFDLPVRLDSLLAGILAWRLAPLVLASPVAVILALIPNWSWWGGVPTPDQSLLPLWSSLAVYLYLFVIGWLLNRQPGLLRQLGDKAGSHGLVAGLAIGFCLSLAGIESDFMPVAESQDKRLYAASYAVALMASTLASLGAGVRLFDRRSALIRYLADGSYWMYIIHLPIVMFLQAALMDVPLHWSVKFTVINLVTFALLLLSYHYLVRDRAIGRWLSGRRSSRKSGAGVGQAVAGNEPVNTDISRA